MKRTAAVFLSILALSALLTGCKIELPDAAAENAAHYISDIAESPGQGDGLTAAAEPVSSGISSDTQLDDIPTGGRGSSAASAGDAVSSPAGGSSEPPDSSKPGGSAGASSAPVSSKTASQLADEANKHQTGGADSEKDRYQTDPIPEGMPKPAEWQDAKIDKTKIRYCTLSIDCLTILDNMDRFNRDKLSVLPEDGIIYKERKVVFYEGESVFDVLNREMKKNRIHMEFVMTPVFNSNYIEGIHNLYEFDCGDLSGWMYEVNGWYPNYGRSRYRLKSGDVIKWRYTCDLGRDLGCVWVGD